MFPEEESNLLAWFAERFIVPLAESLAERHVAPELIGPKVHKFRTHGRERYAHQRVCNFLNYRVVGIIGDFVVLKRDAVLFQDIFPVWSENAHAGRNLAERRVLAALGLIAGAAVTVEHFVVKLGHQLLNFSCVETEIKNFHVGIRKKIDVFPVQQNN